MTLALEYNLKPFFLSSSVTLMDVQFHYCRVGGNRETNTNTFVLFLLFLPCWNVRIGISWYCSPYI